LTNFYKNLRINKRVTLKNGVCIFFVKKIKMKVHIIGGNLGVSIALGLSKFASETKSQLRAETPLVFYI
jgi:hypothetical protein